MGRHTGCEQRADGYNEIRKDMAVEETSVAAMEIADASDSQGKLAQSLQNSLQKLKF